MTLNPANSHTGLGIPQTLIDAKGDLIAGSAADTAARLAVGANDTVLTAASGEATGLKWAAAGGGSTPGAAIVRGPYSFAFDTPNIENGVTVYTPTVGDILIDAWLEVTTAFNGTTPKADIGTFDGTGNNGIIRQEGTTAWSLADADVQIYGTGYLAAAQTGGHQSVPLSYFNFDGGNRVVPGRFVAANPILLVVSQTGIKGGTAIGGTTGAGRIYLVTATPVAL